MIDARETRAMHAACCAASKRSEEADLQMPDAIRKSISVVEEVTYLNKIRDDSYEEFLKIYMDPNISFDNFGRITARTKVADVVDVDSHDENNILLFL